MNTVSDSGSLAWLPDVPDPNLEMLRTIVWVDREVDPRILERPPDAYYQPRLSPDGRQIAVHTVASVAAIWIYDIERASRTRLPFDGFANHPLWTPDGKRVVFSGARAGNVNLFWIPVDGSGPATRLTTNAAAQFPAAWTPDGRYSGLSPVHVPVRYLGAVDGRSDHEGVAGPSNARSGVSRRALA